MGNSIIEAQITLKEEQEKEIKRCEDPHYFYLNYYLDNGKIRKYKEVNKKFFEWWMDIVKDKNIIGIIDLKPRPKL